MSSYLDPLQMKEHNSVRQNTHTSFQISSTTFFFLFWWPSSLKNHTLMANVHKMPNWRAWNLLLEWLARWCEWKLTTKGWILTSEKYDVRVKMGKSPFLFPFQGVDLFAALPKKCLHHCIQGWGACGLSVKQFGKCALCSHATSLWFAPLPASLPFPLMLSALSL